jgi:hypothetical protein
LKGFGIGGVAKEGALASHGDKTLILQLVEVMREGRWRDAKLRADLADDEPLGMRSE